jgi:hypothetical protein
MLPAPGLASKGDQMIGRWIARPSVTWMSTITMLVAMTMTALGTAGSASAAAYLRPAARHGVAAHHRSAVHRRAALHQKSSARRRSAARRAHSNVTLATLVAGVAVRAKPDVTAQLKGRIKTGGTKVTVQCYAHGSRVAGNPVWYRLASPLRGYVTSYYLDSHYDPVAGVTRCTSPPFSRTYHTLVAGVHIRYWPTAFATRLATLGRMGSKVRVTCYVLGESVTGDDVWYHVTRPISGFVSGSHLNTGHDPAYQIPSCW